MIGYIYRLDSKLHSKYKKQKINAYILRKNPCSNFTIQQIWLVRGLKRFSEIRGIEFIGKKIRGLKIYSEKNKGSQNFGLFWRKHSGRVFPIKNDRPLWERRRHAGRFSNIFLVHPSPDDFSFKRLVAVFVPSKFISPSRVSTNERVESSTDSPLLHEHQHHGA